MNNLKVLDSRLVSVQEGDEAIVYVECRMADGSLWAFDKVMNTWLNLIPSKDELSELFNAQAKEPGPKTLASNKKDAPAKE